MLSLPVILNTEDFPVSFSVLVTIGLNLFRFSKRNLQSYPIEDARVN